MAGVTGNAIEKASSQNKPSIGERQTELLKNSPGAFNNFLQTSDKNVWVKNVCSREEQTVSSR